VHEAAHLFRRGGEPLGADAHDHVRGLGRGEVMADRADPAEPLHEDGHLPVRPPLGETFETAELDDVKPGLGDLPAVVEMDGHLAVAFYPGDGVDRDLSRHDGFPLQSYLKTS